MGAPLQRWVNLVENNPDPARVAQFNDWYDNLHLPDVLTCPGFRRARRFERQAFHDGRAQYLALYEIDSADIDETMRVRKARREEEVKKMGLAWRLGCTGRFAPLSQPRSGQFMNCLYDDRIESEAPQPRPGHRRKRLAASRLPAF